MKINSIRVAALLLGLIFSQETFAADLASDFSISNGNPNGNWSYGFTTGLSSGYVLTKSTIPTSSVNSAPGISGWVGTGATSTPLVMYNTAGVTYVENSCQIPGYTAAMHPGTRGEVAIARYTLPASGTYNISAMFKGDDNTSTDVHVLVNGTAIFNSAVNGFNFSTAFSNNFTLPAGATIDFAVGYGNNGYGFDTTGVSASITAVPEPGSLILLASVAVPALLRRRRVVGGEALTIKQ